MSARRNDRAAEDEPEFIVEKILEKKLGKNNKVSVVTHSTLSER